MRTLLEKTREAQALRIATDASADISHVTLEDVILATGQKPEESKDFGRRRAAINWMRWWASRR